MLPAGLAQHVTDSIWLWTQPNLMEQWEALYECLARGFWSRL